jgi:hypothetical protein
MIAFAGFQKHGTVIESHEIYVVPATGGTGRPLTNSPSGYEEEPS